MKVAITISGSTIDAPFDARFGRAAAFCIVDTDAQEWVVRENPALSDSGGAGVRAAQFIAKLGARAVVSGAFGPNAFDTLRAAEVAMYTASADRVFTGSQALAMFEKGELPKATKATNAGHHGGGSGW